MRAVTRFLDLPTANDGTTAAIFDQIHQCLSSRGITYDNLLCFNNDTCNTMKGQRNGVVRHLRDKQPNLVDLGCLWHLENLAIKLVFFGSLASSCFLLHKPPRCGKAWMYSIHKGTAL